MRKLLFLIGLGTVLLWGGFGTNAQQIGDTVAVTISFIAPQTVWLVNLNVVVSGGLIQSLDCGADNFTVSSSSSTGCMMFHDSFGTYNAEVATVYVQKTSQSTVVGVQGFLQDFSWDNVEGAQFIVGPEQIYATATPTQAPTITLPPGVTPTPTPAGPDEITITLPRKTNGPSEYVQDISPGRAIIRCESVYDGGRMTIRALKSPPGQLTSAYVALQTNFDITTSSLGCETMTICLPYLEHEVANAKLTSGQLGMFQYHNDQWIDVTSHTNPSEKQVCGRPQGFSPFIIGSLYVEPTPTVDPFATPTSTPTLTPTPDPNAPTSTPTPTTMLPKSGLISHTFLLLLFIVGMVGLGVFLIL